ncbi:hypothetical protein COV06_00165 [Candidatus Uhrbacteria bacterium CG10_big_fil_rev_8_21_14_0_10_50_16]|uniref:Uncharacterized protein n=1 Tax=Candidatus Uhrbacteria bacterium CG10_big_fil_rev_8_21_14_0_10_50_16 TaxID=1975039 RepID=A0A2H0RMZ4_9BACT|nr:MAG: hypothetical protein COV06_00165 [Candidatus Uhrbacteria bacterium CG10_big_fil_rev_8_21_14_0_10_50_16]
MSYWISRSFLYSIVILLVVLGIGCVFQVVDTGNDLTDLSVITDPPLQGTSDQITGVLVNIGFSGTEIGCDLAESDPVGTRRSCNTGVVHLGLEESTGRVVDLDGVSCSGQEVLVRTEEGVQMEYETTNCAYQIGDRYQVEGKMGQLLDQWDHGTQVEEYIMYNPIITSL